MANSRIKSAPSLPHSLRWSLTNVAATGYFVAASYATISIIARSTGVSQFGQYTFTVSLLSWIETLVVESFAQAAVFAAACSMEERIDQAHHRLLSWACAAWAAMLILSYPLALLCGDRALWPLFFIAAFDIIPWSIFMAGSRVLNARGNYRQSAIIICVYTTTKLVLAGGLGALTGHAGFALLGIVFASASAACICLRYRHCPAQAQTVAPSAQENQRQITPIWSLVLGSSANLMSNADIWLLQLSRSGAAAVGHYAAAANISRVLFFAASAASNAVYPTVARSGSIREVFAKKYGLQPVFALIACILCGGSAVFCLFAPQLIDLLFGASYTGSAAYLMRLAPAFAVLVFGLSFLRGLFYTGRTKEAALISLAGAIAYAVCGTAILHKAGPTQLAYCSGIIGIFLLAACAALSRLNSRRGVKC